MSARPCTCDRVRPGQPYDLSQCRLCWLFYHDASYRRLWAGGLPERAGPSVLPHRSLPCNFRGEAFREVLCPTCAGHVRVKVFACSIHQECTVARPVAGIVCCASCPDYQPEPGSIARSP